MTLWNNSHEGNPEVYSEPSQISKVELFATIAIGLWIYERFKQKQANSLCIFKRKLLIAGKAAGFWNTKHLQTNLWNAVF